MAKKVVYARLQTEAYLPGVGALGSVFPPANKTLDELEMSTVDGSLVINFLHRGFEKEAVVPLGNVIIMETVSTRKPKLKPVA